MWPGCLLASCIWCRASLSTVLFAVAAADPKVIARKLRFTLGLSLLIGLPGMAVLIFGGDLALSMFGQGYARVPTLPLCLLTFSYLPAIPKIHYIAVCRAAGRIPRAAAVLSVAATAEVAAAAAGGATGGLNRASLSRSLGVYLIEGLANRSSSAASGPGRGRHSSGRACGSNAPRTPSSAPMDASRQDSPGSRDRGAYVSGTARDSQAPSHLRQRWLGNVDRPRTPNPS